MRYIFPFSDIKKGCNIVLYGASEVGYDFYRQIVSTEFCRVVSWVDRQYEWYREYLGLPVDDPYTINDCEFDLVVITAEKQSVAESMKDLLSTLGVSEEKIFWKEECLIRGNIARTYDSNTIMKESLQSREENPKLFLRETRLDLVIRYMYAKDYLLGVMDKSHEEMYKRLMMVQNDGKEPTENMISAYFSEYALKRGWKAFKSGFEDLIISMRDNGFRREHFIPLDSSGRMINGAHRFSVALALGIPIWVKNYPYEGIRFDYSENWLRINGFSSLQIQEVKAVFAKILSEGCD